MATHVTVISSTLRQAKIKVVQNTPMSDVLAEACTTFGVSRDNYGLKYKNKNVDLAVPFRFTNLANGAKLDLVVKSKSTGVVSVGLSLPAPENKHFPPNGRLIQKFPSNLTIWQILRQFEESEAAKNAKINITGRGVPQMVNGKETGAGQLYYETPVLSTMGRSLDNFESFQQTLGQLGYNQGNVLLHLSFKMTDKTLAAAQEDISKAFQEMEEKITAEKSDAATKAASEVQAPEMETATKEPSQSPAPKEPEQTKDEPAPEAQQAPSADAAPGQTTEPMDLDGSADREGAGDSLQPLSIFAAPTSSTPAAAHAAFNEADFVPTVADARHHQALLLNSAKNRRLPSDKEIEEQAAAHAAKVAAVKSIEVRVRFPDNTSASWMITQHDTGAKLYNCVRSVMGNNSLPFRLVVPPKDVIRDVDGPNNRLIKAYQLTGRGVIVNLVWDDGVAHSEREKPFLKGSVAQKAREIVVPEIPEGKEETAVAPVSEVGSSSKSESSSSEQLRKISKLFKLPGSKK